MGVRRLRRVERVEASGNPALEIRMLDVNAGVDDGDQNVVAASETMRFGQAQLHRSIKCRIGIGRLRARCGALLLNELIEIVWLAGAQRTFAGETGQHDTHRTAVGDPSTKENRVGKSKIDGLDFDELVPGGERSNILGLSLIHISEPTRPY